jgi:mitochondrial fission protein ELM1
MGGDGSCDISNEMKPQTAALGFRVKSGWAAAVLLAGPAHSPQLCDIRRIELSDPRFPQTRQPYHAAMGKLETDTTKINRRVGAVRCIAQQSVAALLADYRQKGYRIRRAALVVGSQVNSCSIANAHIRAHAFEGQLFRSVLEEALRAHRIRADVLIERNAYAQGATKLKESNENVRRVIQNFGRATEGPWRAEQKLAALAAWLALR